MMSNRRQELKVDLQRRHPPIAPQTAGAGSSRRKKSAPAAFRSPPIGLASVQKKDGEAMNSPEDAWKAKEMLEQAKQNLSMIADDDPAPTDDNEADDEGGDDDDEQKQPSTSVLRSNSFRGFRSAASRLEESNCDDHAPSIGMTSLERLIRTHPIWFLPAVDSRDEIEGLLAGKETGNFIIRQSCLQQKPGSSPSKAVSALSVKLSEDEVRHYLVMQDDDDGGKVHLEESEHRFDNVLAMVFHYGKDQSSELPCLLRLPQTLREADSRQALTSVALLGKDFWRYPMSFPQTAAAQPPSPSPRTRSQRLNKKPSPLYAESSKKIRRKSTTPGGSNSSNNNNKSSNRRSFVDELLPSHQKALFEHQNNLARAQQKLLDVRWVPDDLFKDQQKDEDVRVKTRNKSVTNALDDSLVDLQQVSDLLSESLREIQTQQQSKRGPSFASALSDNNLPLPTPPPRSSSHHASPRQSPARPRRAANKSSEQIVGRNLSPRQRRKLSSPVFLYQQQSQQIKPSRAPISQSYYRSPVQDKMSDYEDIWGGHDSSSTIPTNKFKNRHQHHQDGNRSITPLESETQFKAYLEDKFKESEVGSPDKSRITKDPPRSRKKTVIGISDELLPKPVPKRSSSFSSANSKSTSSSFSTCSSGISFAANSSARRGRDNSSVYSDPLDALERAEDTRIYNCPEFDEINEEDEEEEEEEVKESPRIYRFGVTREISLSSGDLNKSREVGVSLSKVRKISSPVVVVRSGNNKGGEGRNSVAVEGRKRENRLSAVIGKYIKPPRTSIASSGATDETYLPQKRGSWQVDSSSWEFLGLDQNGDGEDKSNASSSSNTASSTKSQVKAENPPDIIASYDNLKSNFHNSNEDSGLDQVKSGSDNSNDVTPKLVSKVSAIKKEEPAGIAVKEEKEKDSSRDSLYESGNNDTLNKDDGNEVSAATTAPLAKGEEEEEASKDGDGKNEEVKEEAEEEEDEDRDVVGLPRPLLPRLSSRHLVARDRIQDCVRRLAAPPASLLPLRQRHALSMEKEVGDAPKHQERKSQSLNSKKSKKAAKREQLQQQQQKEREELVIDGQTTLFALSVSQFVRCTEESREKDPAVVMRNMRQFMSGMKNYLVRNGEGDLQQIIDEERAKLQSDEVLHVDTILESSLQELVTKPLKEHLGRLFAQDFRRSGCLQVLTENMRRARDREDQPDLAPFFDVPDCYRARLADTVETCAPLFMRMRESYSPVDKLDALLAAVRVILNSSTVPSSKLTVEEFSSLLACVLVRLDCHWVEMESEMVWGLLHPSLLAGEGGYYLTMLSSTVHFVKSLGEEEEEEKRMAKEEQEQQHISSLRSAQERFGGGASADESSPADNNTNNSSNSRLQPPNRSSSPPSTATSSLAGTSSFGRGSSSGSSNNSCSIKVLIPPDGDDGGEGRARGIAQRSFPLKPTATSREVLRMVARRMKVPNAEDFALFVLDEGKESLLTETQRPHEVRKEVIQARRRRERTKNNNHQQTATTTTATSQDNTTTTNLEPSAKPSSNNNVFFVFKRHDALIAWPKEFLP